VDFRLLNGVKTYAPNSRADLMQFAIEKKSILIAVNAEKILHATGETRKIINRNVGYPDGMGAVWALKKCGLKNVVKIPGCELWLDVISKYQHSKSFYFLGGEEKIIKNTILKLKSDFPQINICNYRNGFIKSEYEKAELIDDIILFKPDIVCVGMGSPKQELLMEELQQVHAATYLGLGGSFDVYVGNVKRAPNWWVKNNLEWAYRLIKQPSRIRRQIHLIKFLIKLVSNKI
jgi:UDP-N-acetyl-D-mannosaminouronate:lipid I N-acetyl-D-mannosaminouronosyltransferase